MGLIGEDSNPLICGRVVMTSASPLYVDKFQWGEGLVTSDIGPWEVTYLKGCSFDGKGVTIPKAGKYAWTFRMGFQNTGCDSLQFYLRCDTCAWRAALGHWDYYHGSHRVSGDRGTPFMGWHGISNSEPGDYIMPRIYVADPVSDGIPTQIYPKIDQPRSPVWEWFMLSENIGERSKTAWYYY